MAEPKESYQDLSKDPRFVNDATRSIGHESTGSSSPPKRVTFDDFQIQRTQQQQQVEEEKRVWAEKLQREEEHKGLFKFATPRLRKLSDDMIGGRNKFTSFLFGGKPANMEPEEELPEADVTAQPYFAEHEKLVVRVTKKPEDNPPSTLTFRNPDATGKQRTVELNDLPAADFQRQAHFANEDVVAAIDEQLIAQFNEEVEEEAEDDGYELEELEKDEDPASPQAQAYEEDDDDDQTVELPSELTHQFDGEEHEQAYDEEEDGDGDGEFFEDGGHHHLVESEEEEDDDDPESEAEFASQQEYRHSQVEAQVAAPVYESPFKDEPSIDPALKSYLDVLSGFDSFPRRASEPRDPRADFVTLLAEQLDILREQVGAMSALFFWVNNRKQQLVLECGALDDTAHMYLTKEKRFPIEYDAVSMVVTKKKPELHSIIAPQAEIDLIPYYVEAIGIASFAAMPVIFGDGIVGVITVDSLEEECFNAETLRLLTTHSKLISGLIRSYIEKYDLLASARTLEAARKLYQIVSPDSSLRVLKDQRRSPEWILRALTEAASEIVDWEWLATVSFDDTRRAWSINSLQSKHTKPYLLPKTPISLNESIIGKCLSTGRHARIDNLGPSAIRYTLEEDNSSAIGHSFLAIPIRTTNKNYGVLAIEHSERNRFTDADVETLEHLARSAAAALEITALSDIVEERALTDLLTGVFNKRGLTLRLNEELARAMEFDEPLTLVIFEVDGAAEFMSRFSQEDVDTIVLGVTRLLRYGARPFDVIARVGDHSFAALLVRMSDEEGYLWSEKMRKMIVSEVIAIGKRSFSVTVSIGVAGARRDGTTEELIEGAELALERAKELGGNNVIVY
jgi:diguanylate cyclase (GGDEF)-like protein